MSNVGQPMLKGPTLSPFPYMWWTHAETRLRMIDTLHFIENNFKTIVTITLKNKIADICLT